MKILEYDRCTNLTEALDALAEGEYKPVAGGSELLLKFKHGMTAAKKLLDISRVPELNYIKEENGVISIGACVKLREAEESETLFDKAPLLSEVVSEIGTTEIRNVATVGGNICAARANCGVCFLPGCRVMSGDRSVTPCANSAYADLLLPFAAFEARFLLKSSGAERFVPVMEFAANPRTLDIKQNELLAGIQFEQSRAKGWGYARFRYPASLGLPFISVAARPKGDKADIVVGGSVRGLRRYDDLPVRNAADVIGGDIEFNDCLRFSPAYRKTLTPVIIGEALDKASWRKLHE
jgi:CO/xanthine dehydrogenase FAD-binding subunit